MHKVLYISTQNRVKIEQNFFFFFNRIPMVNHAIQAKLLLAQAENFRFRVVVPTSNNYMIALILNPN